jgi:hypothetical protein
MKLNLDRVQELSETLALLLKDRHPGLVTWRESVLQILEQLRKELL